MKTVFKTLLVFLLILTASVSYAGFEVGNDLVQGWREHQKIMQHRTGEIDFMLASRFVGYVTGVFDATEFLYDYPDGLTKDQVAAIVGKYLDANPEEWSKGGPVLVIKALQEAFPRKNR